MNVNEKIFIRLIKTTIDECQNNNSLAEINYQELLKFCLKHSVSCIVFEALKDFKTALPENLYNALKQKAQQDIMKDIQGSYDVETVISAFENNGIKFIPLKGYYLKKLYPKSEMRYATDYDVLIDEKQIDKVHEVAKSLGMVLKQKGDHHDIFYFPETKTVFEFHKSIFEGSLKESFGNGFDRARLKEGYKSFYELPPEDFYISILGHSAYHFAHGGGVGIRHVIDVYLYKKAYKFNDKYLERELEKCGLADFRKQFEKLADYFFADGEGDEFTEKLADYVLDSSVLGNENKKQASDIVSNNSDSKIKSAKLKTLIQLILPPFKTMKGYYPILKSLPVLLPFCYIARWLTVLIKRPKSLKKINKITGAKNEEITEIKEIREKLGLNNI
ncbi:MAG: nucleotidyltransferase family protein [Clostridia bacterium]|nr:nucleotidyltransferase family protein [Clostridia bacterium]